MSGYCDIAPGHPEHGPYHDKEYGFPLDDDAGLLERFALEINQAGLSWHLMLKKRPAFHKAFRGFDVDRVARFTVRDETRLLQDAGIVRNKLKVRAVIENAKRIRALRKTHGTFAAWIAANHPRTKAEWVKLFKKEFVFTGGEIVGEFLMSIGYLPGAHRQDCPAAKRIKKIGAPWQKARDFVY
jgi:DNA-3-methyladenine glycosylase I